MKLLAIWCSLQWQVAWICVLCLFEEVIMYSTLREENDTTYQAEIASTGCSPNAGALCKSNGTGGEITECGRLDRRNVGVSLRSSRRDWIAVNR